MFGLWNVAIRIVHEFRESALYLAKAKRPVNPNQHHWNAHNKHHRPRTSLMPTYYEQLLNEIEVSSAKHPRSNVVFDAKTFEVIAVSTDTGKISRKIQSSDPKAVTVIVSPSHKKEAGVFHFCPAEP